MTTFRAPCPRCRSALHLPTDAVLLVAGAGPGAAWVVCVSCQDVVAVHVDDAAVTELVRAGCHLLDAPAAVEHPELRPAGPALTADDALALHELLADDDAVAAVLRGLGTAAPGA